MIIIPEEAELVIPAIRKKTNHEGQNVVHLITYMAPLMRDMRQFDSLSFYALPPLPADHQVPGWLSMELGAFAGRTFADFSDCLALQKSMEDNHDDGTACMGGFSPSPFAFLYEWLALRRKGQDITHTPVGYVCRGRPLSRDHYFFVEQAVDAACRIEKSVKSMRKDQDSDEG